MRIFKYVNIYIYIYIYIFLNIHIYILLTVGSQFQSPMNNNSSDIRWSIKEESGTSSVENLRHFQSGFVPAHWVMFSLPIHLPKDPKTLGGHFGNKKQGRHIYIYMYDRPLGLIWTPPLAFILYHPFCRTLIFSFSFQAPRSRTLRNFLNLINFINFLNLEHLQNFWAQTLSKIYKFRKLLGPKIL